MLEPNRIYPIWNLDQIPTEVITGSEIMPDKKTGKPVWVIFVKGEMDENDGTVLERTKEPIDDRFHSGQSEAVPGKMEA